MASKEGASPPDSLMLIFTSSKRPISVSYTALSLFGLHLMPLFSDRGMEYEFFVAAKNDEGYGEQAVATIQTPDGSEYCATNGGGWTRVLRCTADTILRHTHMHWF
jgi:hypothetical protein